MDTWRGPDVVTASAAQGDAPSAAGEAVCLVDLGSEAATRRQGRALGRHEGQHVGTAAGGAGWVPWVLRAGVLDQERRRQDAEDQGRVVRRTQHHEWGICTG